MLWQNNVVLHKYLVRTKGVVNMLTMKDIKLLRHYPWFIENPTHEQVISGRLIPLSVTPKAKAQLAKEKKRSK